MTDALEVARQTLDRTQDRVAVRPRKRFTIATLVNNRTHYDEMLASFEDGGFERSDCEYLFVDNTGSEQTCAFRGLDRLLAEATGDYVILCHQDVRIVDDGHHELETRLAQLDALDPMWAVAGNAGGVSPGKLAIRITDPHGANQKVGTLPAKVMSLDENFLVVKRQARLSFSRDLSGFHFYGADLCLVADVLGYTTYVIDFHLEHLSGGMKGASFATMEAAFSAKWGRAFRPRFLQTTCSLISLTGDSLTRMLGRVAAPSLSRITKRLPSAAGWSRRSA
ncbi:MAG: hypothetical protein ABL904_14575 [Hyphomicrobiaceae bacterium]